MWDMDKTADGLCHSWGVSNEHAYTDMLFIKQLFCQLEGRQYLHWVLSHDEGVALDVVDKVAVEIMRMVGEKYQLIVATHTNTSNYHTHFLINSVNYLTGKKFSESRQDMLDFREKINAILKRYGLNICGKVVSISEKKLDEAEEEEKLKAWKNGITQPVTIYEEEDDQLYRGYGVVEGENVYLPGMLYAKKDPTKEPDLIAGMVYEPEESGTENLVRLRKEYIQGMVFDNEPNKEIMEVSLHEGETIFKGQGMWSDGRFYVPGMLYEADEE